MDVEQNTPFSFVNAELDTLKFWQGNKIFQQTLEKTRSGPVYIFYDGPPFATGLPHHGHLVASTIKDIVPRFFTMKGHYVDRRFGWDCHGLPIEQEIDKKHQVSAMDFVKEHGIKSYNAKCRKIVQTFTVEWERTITRLGRWVDFENDYKTMDLPFMESVWWVFKQAWDKNKIYKGSKVVPFSTALGTGLANFEATQNYVEVQDPAITVKFKLEDEQAYLLAWTTTPWTLPSNLALVINSDLTYSKVREEKSDEVFYLAKERLAHYQKYFQLSEIEEVPGSQLMGKRYRPLFSYFADLKQEGAFQVLADSFVSATDGTGIVHCAPAFGEDDNRVMAQAGLISSEKSVIVCPVDNAGKFTDSVSDFKGQYVKDADKEIIKYLKKQGRLLHQSTIKHNYPFCYRTDTPLIYKTMPQWYLKVSNEDMLKSNEQIRWVPGHIKNGRFGKWLENARDWAISRNRYWGTPLPLWQNDVTGEYICVGSVRELEKLSGEEVTDLHRDCVDEITFKLDNSQGTYRRIPDVLDCWFESGSMPYAQIHYPFENKGVFEKGFPAEFIAEGLDQTRGWFYTLNFLSSMLFERPAFKNVIVNGMVLAEDGRKMSKRLKNYTPPDTLMETYGADALRLFLINSGIVKGEELKFSDNGVKDMVRRALLPWYNSFKFFITYSEVDGWNPSEHLKFGHNITDKWILSKLQTLTNNVNHEMENYRLYNVVPTLFSFIEDLTNWYIRLNRRRFWEKGLLDDKKHAYSALYRALITLSELMAPFAPFLSEHIYRELHKMGHLKEVSVHLRDYPPVDKKLIDTALEEAVSKMQQIILMGRQKRAQENIKVKTPLRKITVIHTSIELLDEIKKLEEYILIELNLKSIDYESQEEKFISLYAKPNSPILGPKLGKDFGRARKVIESFGHFDLKKFEKDKSLSKNDFNFTSEDLLLFREPKEGTQAISNSFITIDLDCQLDKDLVQEGLAREVVNRIQKTRKEINLNVDDRIDIFYHADQEIKEAIENYIEYIKGETLCDNITAQNKALKHQFTIDENSLVLSIKRSLKA